MNGRGLEPTLLGWTWQWSPGDRGRAARRRDGWGDGRSGATSGGSRGRALGADEALEERTRASAEARAGPRSDPRLDAGRRPVVRRRMANGVRQRRASSDHLGARPETLAQVFPPSLRETIRRVAETERVEVAEIETGAPTRWLRVTATPDGDRRVGAGRDRRRHRGAAFGCDPSRLRRERVPRVEDAGGVDPGRRGDAPARVAGGPGGGAPVRRAARTGGGAALSDRGRSPGSVPAGIGQRAPGSGAPGRAGPGGDIAVRRCGASRPGSTMDVEAASVPAVRGSGRDLSLLVRNLLDNAIRYTKDDGTRRRVGVGGQRVGRRSA